MAASSPSWWSKDTVAVVTGANQGIGLEMTRQLAQKGLTVVLTARNPSRGQAALETLKAEGLKSVVFHPLDVLDPKSVEELASWLTNEFGHIDILINNAGINSYDQFNYELAKSVVETNFYAIAKLTEALLPLLRASPSAARIINVTSRLGVYNRLETESLKEQFRSEESYTLESTNGLASKYLEDVKAGRHVEEGWLPQTKTPMYSESKMFLNMYTVALAKDLAKSQPKDHPIIVTAFCPGVTQTGMLDNAISHGFVAPEGFQMKTIPEGADTGVWLALLPKTELEEKNGKLFGERQEWPFSLAADF